MAYSLKAAFFLVALWWVTHLGEAEDVCTTRVDASISSTGSALLQIARSKKMSPPVLALASEGNKAVSLFAAVGSNSKELLEMAGYSLSGYQGSPNCVPENTAKENRRLGFLALQASLNKHSQIGDGGATAALDGTGFKLVTSLCCPSEMEMFFNRLLEQLKYNVCSKPHVQGLMHWFSCVPDMDFQYVLDIIANGNPCKYWAPFGQSCPVLSDACYGRFCAGQVPTTPTVAAPSISVVTDAPGSAALATAAPTRAAPTTAAPTTATPTTAAPTTAASTSAAPTTAAPTTAALTTATPTTAAPTTAALTTAAPTTAAPTTTAPTTAPTTEAPTTAAPTTVAPTTAAPTTAAPTTAAPTIAAPTTAAPTTAAPTTAPTTEAPTTAAPTTVAPTTVAPTIAAPTTAAPTTATPTTAAPTTAVSTSAAPTTATPTTAAPTIATPTTAAPTTAAPTTAAPTTAAPTTAAPTTAPTTEAPTTAAPTTVARTTSAPTTAAPTTAAPTTAAPTTAAPTTAAPTTAAPDTCSKSNAVAVNFQGASVTHNNLGGLGPDTGSADLRYAKVGSVNGQEFDIVVTVAGGTYDKGKKQTNGLSGNLAKISLKKDLKVHLKFTFMLTDTSTPVELPEVHISFLDIDGSGDQAYESMRASGFSKYVVDGDTRLVVDAKVYKSGSQRVEVHQTVGNVLNPVDAHALTQDQKNVALMLVYKKSSSFVITYAVHGGPARSMLIAGASSLDAACEA